MLRAMVESTPPKAGAIAELERKIGSVLPEDYRRFVEQYDGGFPEPPRFPITWSGQPWARRFPYDDVSIFFGPSRPSPSNLLVEQERYRDRVPRDTLPIGMDPGGSLLLLGISGQRRGQVLFWASDYEVDEGDEPDDRNVGFVAPSFTAFLDALVDDIAPG